MIFHVKELKQLLDGYADDTVVVMEYIKDEIDFIRKADIAEVGKHGKAIILSRFKREGE